MSSTNPKPEATRSGEQDQETQERVQDDSPSPTEDAANQATNNGQAAQQATQQATQQVGQTTPQPVAPQHPFYRLPPELILDIVDILPPESFINFAFANYPLLHANGLAPALSGSRVSYITSNTRLPALFPLIGRMPAEIMLHIMRNLRPVDIMRFVIANYQTLARQGIAPPLTDETARQLWNAVRARFSPG